MRLLKSLIVHFHQLILLVLKTGNAFDFRKTMLNITPNNQGHNHLVFDIFLFSEKGK